MCKSWREISILYWYIYWHCNAGGHFQCLLRIALGTGLRFQVGLSESLISIYKESNRKNCFSLIIVFVFCVAFKLLCRGENWCPLKEINTHDWFRRKSCWEKLNEINDLNSLYCLVVVVLTSCIQSGLIFHFRLLATWKSLLYNGKVIPPVNTWVKHQKHTHCTDMQSIKIAQHQGHHNTEIRLYIYRQGRQGSLLQ